MSRSSRLRLTALLTFAVALAALTPSLARAADAANPAAPIPIEPRDPWTASDLVESAALAKSLSGPAAERPAVFCVGMARLYRSAHIPGAKYAGPGAESEGLQKLKDAVQTLSRETPIVIYCGCCPWTHCPNIRPAFKTVHDLGFRSVRVLVMPENFHDDWTAKGLPVEKS